MKSFSHCPHCGKHRWGSLQITPETELTVNAEFHCSYCQMVSSETRTVLKKKWHPWIRRNFQYGNICMN